MRVYFVGTGERLVCSFLLREKGVLAFSSVTAPDCTNSPFFAYFSMCVSSIRTTMADVLRLLNG